MKCQQCSIETYMPFKCPYCKQYFCVEHRLPENHNCPEYWRVQAPRSEPQKPIGKIKLEPSQPYRFTSIPYQRTGKFIWLSATELKHLFIGIILTLAIGFSMPLYWGSSLYGSLDRLAVLAIVFTFSFIIHELAHKITAQHYGLWAEFRITMFGAMITILSIISPFKIISPGAVMVGGAADRKIIGKTSIAGPLTNISLAAIFLLGYLALDTQVLEFGLIINSFIALFNLIPFGILDGFKIFLWNKIVWATAFFTSLTLTIIAYAGLPFIL